MTKSRHFWTRKGSRADLSRSSDRSQCPGQFECVVDNLHYGHVILNYLLLEKNPHRAASSLKVKKVKVARYCRHDWQYKLEMEKMLEPDETEAVLEGRPSRGMY